MGRSFALRFEAVVPRRDRPGATTLPRIASLHLCWAVALLAAGARPSPGADDPRPPSATKDEAPVYLFLEGQNDLDALRKRLARPDFVILKGPLYEALKAQSRPGAPPRAGVVESVSVGGEVLDDLAHLTIDFGIAVSGGEPCWVPIRLDGQIVTAAREGDRDLPIRSVDGSLQVRLQGEGHHRVQVTLSSVVLAAKGSADGRKLAWSIPEAASTRVQLALPASASEVVATGPTGNREPLATEAIEGDQRRRASAYLTPRKSLEITWKAAADPGSTGPPLITAQGEIAIDIERGSLRARSSWEVRSERGTVRRLDLRIDPSDELVGLECDGRPVASDEPRDAATGAVAIPLAEPLAPGGFCRLVVTTRRALSPESTTRTAYRGVPLLNVVAQTGVLAISQRGGDPWVSASPGRGLRPIDPRTELPATLRAKPSIILAYQFVEQPFDLALQVDPSPPWSRVESRTTLAIEPNRAKVDAWFDYVVAKGRVFEARVSLPEGMSLDSVGPDASIGAWELLPGEAGGRRVLAARLSPKASEDGKFSIHLVGRQACEPGKRVVVGLPKPAAAQSRGGLLAVVAPRGVAVELALSEQSPSTEFSAAGQEPPASWPWPPGSDIASTPPALWLRHEEAPASVPLAIALRDRVVREESTLDARVDRRRVDVRQETTIRVRNGSIARLDIEVPPEVEGAWDVEGVEVAHREPIGPGDSGSIRYRLTLGREITDTARLRFRLRDALQPGLEPERPMRVVIPRLMVLGAESTPPRVRVGAEEGIDLAGDGLGWSDATEERVASSEADLAMRLERTSTGPSAVLATAHAVAVLPRLVASRLTIRTSRDAGGGLRTTAWYRLESHEGSLVVLLPPGAEWTRARVGAEAVAEVEQVSQPSGAHRLKLPTEGVGPLVVMLEYTQTASSLAATGGWAAPRLPGGAVVQETFWEVRLPAHLALVGVPTGWSDENEWSWNSYAFMRRPAQAATTTATTPDDAMREGAHAYLFSRLGPPASLAPLIVSRASLVGVGSGVVLGLGLLLMAARGWARTAWAFLPALLLAGFVVSPPSLIPLAAQSSALGFVLLGVAVATQGLVDRRRPGGMAAEPSGLVVVSASASGRRGVPEVGSEDSTVVRARSGTTVDRAPHDPATTGASG